MLTPAQATEFLENETYSLTNGLTVILHNDRRSPFVAVRVRYRVGALNELGRPSGMAHLFEHLLFRGSVHLEREDPHTILQKIGALNWNGETGLDATDYYEVVPSVNLETVLWMESDRMGFPSLSSNDLADERRIVRNERRQHFEITAYGLAELRLWGALFPAPHPYHNHVIGSPADLAAIKDDDIRAFFHRWYVPSNAILTLAGDFDPNQARAWIQKYFGTLPSRPRPLPKPVPLVHLKREIIISHAEEVGVLPRVSIAWLTPEIYTAGDAASDLLASILLRGRSGRLRSLLIPDVALSLTVEQQSHQAQSVFRVTAQTEQPAELHAVVAALDATLQEIVEHGITDEELGAARIYTRNHLFSPLQNARAKALLLSDYQAVTGTSNWLAQDMVHHQLVTAEDIRALVREYLGQRQRVIVYAVPTRLAPAAALGTAR